MNRTRKISSISVILMLLAAVVLSGCATSRTVMIAPVDSPSRSLVPVPFSVHVEIRGVKEEDPNPVTPIAVDKESLKRMIVRYLAARSTFDRVLDGLADSVLNIDVTYHLRQGNSFQYAANLKAALISKDGRDLGSFSGQSTVQGGMTRFSASADVEPMNSAMVQAIENLCLRIEESRPLILAKLGRQDALPQAAKPLIRSDVDDIQITKSKTNPNAYAVVIGIEQYRQKLPAADFAVSDAQTVTDYLTKAMGYPAENIITLTNDRAALGDFVKYIERWLPNNIEHGSTVSIYYSGHGAPNTKTGDAYLVPYDGDPTFIAETGYSLKRMYDALGKLPAKEIIVALDSCFSGAGGRSVLAKGARPLVMNLKHDAVMAKNITVLAASSGEQSSSTYDEKGHGLFTYFLLKGIKNENVVKQDGSLAIQDLFSYMKPQVERIARKQYNNEQIPQLIGPNR